MIGSKYRFLKTDQLIMIESRFLIGITMDLFLKNAMKMVL